MRYVAVAVAVLLLIGGLAAVKFKQISSLIAMGKQMEKSGPPPETVATTKAEAQKWSGSLTAIGTITAVKGVTISNDAPGIVTAIKFESGAVVTQGQVLVQLDSHVERSQIAAIDARRELAEINVGRTRALVETAAIPSAQLDTDLSILKASRADLGALKAQIDRKTVRAPFAGKLGLRTVNLGQYVAPGTPLTVLEATDAVFVDFSLPQQRLPSVLIGMPIKVAIDGATTPPLDGAIAAIDPTVDPATRTLKLRANVPNKGEALRPGMFVNVAVTLPEQPPVVIVPASSVVRASYGNSVFVAEEKKDESGAPVKTADGQIVKTARQQFVRTGESRGDFVAILDGVKAGEEIVSSGAFKLRNNAPIVVNNDVLPKTEISPNPANR